MTDTDTRGERERLAESLHRIASTDSYGALSMRDREALRAAAALLARQGEGEVEKAAPCICGEPLRWLGGNNYACDNPECAQSGADGLLESLRAARDSLRPLLRAPVPSEPSEGESEEWWAEYVKLRDRFETACYWVGYDDHDEHASDRRTKKSGERQDSAQAALDALVRTLAGRKGEG